MTLLLSLFVFAGGLSLITFRCCFFDFVALHTTASVFSVLRCLCTDEKDVGCWMGGQGLALNGNSKTWNDARVRRDPHSS